MQEQSSHGHPQEYPVNPPEDAIRLEPRDDGAIVMGLRVKPGAKRDAAIGVHGDRLKVSVRAAPERGRANEAVVRLLETLFGVSSGDVELTAGHASQDKVVHIRGCDEATLRRALSRVLTPTPS